MTNFDNQSSSRLLDFWNDRSKLDYLAGTNDFVAKELEMRTLSQYFSDGLKVLEVGCGNGIAAIELAKRFGVSITGIDFSPGMIDAAQERLAAQKDMKGSVRFCVGDVRDVSTIECDYDIAYTERVIINLPDWVEQGNAIRAILEKLKPGGKYLMCENSADGLDGINELRTAAGLPAISAPWHNRYLRDAEVAQLVTDGAKLSAVIAYSSSYYIISRVVNAWLAKREDREPAYDAPINQLGLMLPSIGEVGQGKLWVWERV